MAAYGAKIANSAAELADRDIVFATVGTPQDLLDAVLGPAGLISGGAAPTDRGGLLDDLGGGLAAGA